MPKLEKSPANDGGRARTPSLADELRQSGETEVSAAERALRADREDLRFLGREFLTWLVYHVEENGGAFAGDAVGDDGGDFTIGFGERLKCQSLGSEISEAVFKGGSPGDALDTRYAIAGGLSVREAELVLVRGEKTFSFALTSDSFDLRRVNLPDLINDSDDHAEDMAAERLTLLDELDACLRSAFAHFLGLRLSSGWSKKHIPALREWLATALSPPA
jgi:hypothetical protein